MMMLMKPFMAENEKLMMAPAEEELELLVQMLSRTKLGLMMELQNRVNRLGGLDEHGLQTLDHIRQLEEENDEGGKRTLCYLLNLLIQNIMIIFNHKNCYYSKRQI
jgi:hypothetical protein